MARQKSGPQDSTDNDIHDVDLSGITSPQNLGAVTIAMSHLSGLSFGADSSLQGATWIGNAVRGFKHCTLEELDLSKTCLINASFDDYNFSNVQLAPGTILNGKKTLAVDTAGKLAGQRP